MSFSVTFTGPGFYLTDATQSGGGKIRVSFSQPPLAINPAGATDALNPVRWTVTGPVPRTVATVALISPLVVELTLTGSLTAGAWTVAVSGVVDTGGASLTSPTSVTILVGVTPYGLLDGAEAETAERVLRKHLSGALAGPNWDALIYALSYGDEHVWDLAKNALRQLFAGTATDVFLDTFWANKGIYRPAGFSDEQFRDLAVKLHSGQVTPKSILEILESFFGPAALRAFADSSTGPWSIPLGGAPITIDGQRYVLPQSLFGSPGIVSASELVSALNMVVPETAGFADLVEGRARFFSPTLGLSSVLLIDDGGLFGFAAVSRATQGARSVAMVELGEKATVYAPPTLEIQPEFSGSIAGAAPVVGTYFETKGNFGLVSTATPHGLTVGQYIDVDFQPASGLAHGSLPTAGTLGGAWVHRVTRGTNLGGTSDCAYPQAQVTWNGSSVVVQGGQSTITGTTTAVGWRLVPSNGTALQPEQSLNATTLQYTATALSGGPAVYAAGANVLAGPFAGATLLTGGLNGSGVPTENVFLLEPSASAWTPRAPMAIKRAYHTQQNLPNGDVLVVGGLDSGTSLATNTTEIFTPAINSWRAGPSMTYKKSLASSVVLSDGKVAVFGGQDDSFVSLRALEIYNPATNTWSFGADMPTTRHTSKAFTLPNGDVWVLGGYGHGTYNGADLELEETYIYSYGRNEWRPGPKLPPYGEVWVAAQNNIIYIGSSAYAEIVWTTTNLEPVRAVEFGVDVQYGIGTPYGIVLGGGDDGSGNNVRYFRAISGNYQYSNPKIPRLRVHSVPTANTVVLSGSNGYTTSHGPDVAVSLSRTGSTVTVNAVPTYEDANSVYINSADANFSSGLKTIVNKTATSVQYTESGAAASGSGFASFARGPIAVLPNAAEEAVGFVAVDADQFSSTTNTTLLSALSTGVSYGLLSVASTTGFEQGVAVIGLGTEYAKQVRVLEIVSSTALKVEPFSVSIPIPVSASVDMLQKVEYATEWSLTDTGSDSARTVVQGAAAFGAVDWAYKFRSTYGLAPQDEEYVWGVK